MRLGYEVADSHIGGSPRVYEGLMDHAVLPKLVKGGRSQSERLDASRERHLAQRISHCTYQCCITQSDCSLYLRGLRYRMVIGSVVGDFLANQLPDPIGKVKYGVRAKRQLRESLYESRPLIPEILLYRVRQLVPEQESSLSGTRVVLTLTKYEIMPNGKSQGMNRSR